MSPGLRLQRVHQGTVALVLGVLAVTLAFAFMGKIFEVVFMQGKVVADHNLALVHANANGLVTRVFASVGDHLDKDAPLLLLDPNMSPEKLADTESRLSTQQDEKSQLEKNLAVVQQLIAAPESLRTASLSTLGASGETFNLLNEVITARQDLETAAESRRINAAHQREQTSSELAMVQRNIELLKRNLEVAKRDAKTREETVALKRRDFDGLMKLAEKGLVSATDVNRDRDSMLAAETAFSDVRKQVDQIELDISNRNLATGTLRMQNETSAEEANNRYNGAKLRFDLRMARLKEHKVTLERQVNNAQQNLTSMQSSLKVAGEGGPGLLVRTPVAGTLVRLRFVSSGDSVNLGAHVATLLPDGAAAVVLARLPHRDVGRVREGQSARIKVDAYPYVQFGSIAATVTRVFAEPDSPEFTAKLLLSRPSIDVHGTAMPLLPGMRTHVEVFTEERRLIDLLVYP